VQLGFSVCTLFCLSSMIRKVPSRQVTLGLGV
jgi:hypothetical protein